jgi:hypothetical protein
MKHFLQVLFMTVIMCMSVYAQDTVAVAPDGASGGNLNAAISAAIGTNTLSSTVFLLSAGSGSGEDYILTSIVTTPLGQKLTIIAPPTSPSSPPPQICMQTGGGVTWTQNFDCFGDVLFKNIWIMYTTTAGIENGAGLDIEDDSVQNKEGLGENAEFDNCIFDLQQTGTDGAVELKCQHFRGKFSGCYFRNDVDPHYRYYGRAVSWPYSSTTYHTDSVSFTNCTFANLGYIFMQESPEFSDHVWFNHCTFLNSVMFTLESSYWYWLSVTNCIYVNAYMYGDLPGVAITDTSYNPNGGAINIDSVKNFGFVPLEPGAASTDTAFTDAPTSRHIYFANNSYNIDPWLVTYMAKGGNPYSDTASFPNLPRPQPMMSTKTQKFFIDSAGGQKLFPYMTSQNLYDSTDPAFIQPPTNIDSIEVFLFDKWYNNANCFWAYYPSDDIDGVWPMNESLTYTNPKLLTAGMGNFPLGDLYNWFPSKYTQWLAQEKTENTNINNVLTNGPQPPNAVKKGTGNLPSVFSLSQNYPNPFNPTTVINYTVPQGANISLKVYNILGQLVATLYNGYQKPGSYAVNFSASKLASGIYFYRLESNSFNQTKKMVLMK